MKSINSKSESINTIIGTINSPRKTSINESINHTPTIIKLKATNNTDITPDNTSTNGNNTDNTELHFENEYSSEPEILFSDNTKLNNIKSNDTVLSDQIEGKLKKTQLNGEYSHKKSDQS